MAGERMSVTAEEPAPARMATESELARVEVAKPSAFRRAWSAPRRQFDVPRVVARNNYPENRWLFNDRWGVDVAVSASATLLSLIQEATGATETVDLLQLGTAGVRMIETTIRESSAAVGKTLAEISLPPGTVIATIIRGREPRVPGGSFSLQAGDEVILVSEAATEQDIQVAFQRQLPSQFEQA